MDFEHGNPCTGKFWNTSGSICKKDEEAARLLASLMTRDNLLSLTALTCGNEVTVCGNAPCLKDELAGIQGIVFAADAAVEVLDAHDIRRMQFLPILTVRLTVPRVK